MTSGKGRNILKKVIAFLFTILLSANIAYAEKVRMYSRNNGQTITSKEQKTKQLANITPGQKKFLQAGTLFNNKYYQKTIKNLNEIINNKEDPFFWKGYETDLSCVYQLLGMCGKAKEALPYLEYAVKIRPVPEILFHRGCCCEVLGEKAF